MVRQVFWAARYVYFRRGMAALKHAGFHPVVRKEKNKHNGMTIWHADVPGTEFRRASKFVSREF